MISVGAQAASRSVVVEAEQAAVDLVVVLAERRPGGADRARGGGQPRGRRSASAARRSPGAATRTIASRAAKCGSANMSLARKIRPAGTPPSCSGRQQLVGRLASRSTRRSGRRARPSPRRGADAWRSAGPSASSGCPSPSASRPKTRVLVGGDQDQVAVAGRVDVARRDVGQHRRRCVRAGSRRPPTPAAATPSSPAPPRRSPSRRPGRGRCGCGCAPRPACRGRRRWRRASRRARCRPGTGGRSGSPVTYRMPPIASPIEPKPARGGVRARSGRSR